MADVFTKEKRSAVMAAIRSRGNRDTEGRMVLLLRAAGLTGWRRHTALPGRPDFVFRAGRVAVFVDGCYWHGCPRHCRIPKTRTGYWTAKIARNGRRDRQVTRLLRAKRWRVLRVWEHDLARPDRVLARLQRMLAAGPMAPRQPRRTSPTSPASPNSEVEDAGTFHSLRATHRS